MKLGKLINKGHKCPTCKKFGLQLCSPEIFAEGIGIMKAEEVGVSKPPQYGEELFYRCKNCYAEFEAKEKK